MLAVVHGRGRLELRYGDLIERAGSVEVGHSNLGWWDLERYTNRQEGKLSAGGMIGEVEYAGRVIDELMPLLCAGELLGVGTGTSLGLGRYQISAGEVRKV
jgi:CRISPR/Cas system endoribonuclease Cas6 (RAMP superfamily)